MSRNNKAEFYYTHSVEIFTDCSIH